jgi:hypothetical protein
MRTFYTDEPEYPSNHREIMARLAENIACIYEHLPLWTYDQAAQVITGIDCNGFNQYDADHFEFTSEKLELLGIDGQIAHKEHKGEILLRSSDVMEWAIRNEYKIPDYVLAWYDEYKRKNMIGESYGSRLATSKESASENPWDIPDSRDPEPEQSWYIAARYFARQLVREDSTLLRRRSILAKQVAESLNDVGIKKRGGKKPFDPATVRKAFSKVTLG